MGDNLKILIYGYGNPGRQDDGLGSAFAEYIMHRMLPGVYCDTNYQLNIEDALEISRYDAVIFVDASINAVPPFEFYKLLPSREISFTTHAMPAQSVLALCEELYKKIPESYMLEIRGYGWEALEGLTGQAEQNFKMAAEFIIPLLKEKALASLDGAAKDSPKCKI